MRDGYSDGFDHDPPYFIHIQIALLMKPVTFLPLTRREQRASSRTNAAEKYRKS